MAALRITPVNCKSEKRKENIREANKTTEFFSIEHHFCVVLTSRVAAAMFERKGGTRER